MRNRLDCPDQVISAEGLNMDFNAICVAYFQSLQLHQTSQVLPNYHTCISIACQVDSSGIKVR